MSGNKLVKYENYFSSTTEEERNSIGYAVNRISFSQADFDEKCKAIDQMLELGMDVFIDEMGSVRGTLKLGNGQGKHIAMGSHNDSVKDGDEFDGALGVYNALATAENLKARGVNGYFSAVVISSEESTADKQACSASMQYAGKSTLEEYDKRKTALKYKGVDNKTHRTMGKYREIFVRELKKKYNGRVQFVDKVINQTKEESKDEKLGKIDEWVEVHIEQSDELKKQYEENGKKPVFGLVNSIGTATRGEYFIEGNIIKANKLKNSMNLNFNIVGSSDHTGGKPMKERKDAMLAQSILSTRIIQYANKNSISVKAIGFKTNTMLTNQVAGQADLNISLDVPKEDADKIKEDINKIVEEVKQETSTEVTTNDGLNKNVNNIEGYKEILMSAALTKWMYELAEAFEDVKAGKATVVGGEVGKDGKIKLSVDIRMLGRTKSEEAVELINTSMQRVAQQVEKGNIKNILDANAMMGEEFDEQFKSGITKVKITSTGAAPAKTSEQIIESYKRIAEKMRNCSKKNAVLSGT